jgi:hypothetical protein
VWQNRNVVFCQGLLNCHSTLLKLRHSAETFGTRVRTMTCGKRHGARYMVCALHACARRSTLTSRTVTRPYLDSRASFREPFDRSSYVVCMRKYCDGEKIYIDILTDLGIFTKPEYENTVCCMRIYCDCEKIELDILADL